MELTSKGSLASTLLKKRRKKKILEVSISSSFHCPPLSRARQSPSLPRSGRADVFLPLLLSNSRGKVAVPQSPAVPLLPFSSSSLLERRSWRKADLASSFRRKFNPSLFSGCDDMAGKFERDVLAQKSSSRGRLFFRCLYTPTLSFFANSSERLSASSAGSCFCSFFSFSSCSLSSSHSPIEFSSFSSSSPETCPSLSPPLFSQVRVPARFPRSPLHPSREAFRSETSQPGSFRRISSSPPSSSVSSPVCPSSLCSSTRPQAQSPSSSSSSLSSFSSLCSPSSLLPFFSPSLSLSSSPPPPPSLASSSPSSSSSSSLCLLHQPSSLSVLSEASSSLPSFLPFPSFLPPSSTSRLFLRRDRGGKLKTKLRREERRRRRAQMEKMREERKAQREGRSSSSASSLARDPRQKGGKDAEGAGEGEVGAAEGEEKKDATGRKETSDDQRRRRRRTRRSSGECVALGEDVLLLKEPKGKERSD